MLNVVKSVKSLLILTSLFSLVIWALSQYPVIWQPHISNITYVYIGLSVFVIVFAAQFSKSRISFATAIWLLSFGFIQENLSLFDNAQQNQLWLVISATLSIGLLVWSKDRGILSIHGILRLLLLIFVGAVSFAWLNYQPYIASLPVLKDVITPQWSTLWLAIPIIISGVLAFGRTLFTSNLVNNALLLSLLASVFIQYQWVDLPVAILFLSVVSLYLLVVIIDSYFLAYRDELTELPSRRALNQLSLSLGRKYSVAMMDIDHFKKFNDTYGHDIGDQVLKLVASKLATIKSNGKVFRYGGEEFTVVFSRKDKEQVMAELDRIRQLIADYKIVIRQPQRSTKKQRNTSKKDGFKTVSVTISIGVTTREAKQSFAQAIKVADQALYRAKKKGRNNVSI